MIAALKAHEEVKLTVLRGILTAFTNELVAKGKKPTEQLGDDEAIAVIKRLGKQRKDSIEQFTAGNRADLAEREQQELLILEAYMPQLAGKDEIEKVAKAKIAEMGVTDKSAMGKLIGAVMKEFGTRADGNDVKEVLQKLL